MSSGFRNVGGGFQRRSFTHGTQDVVVGYRHDRDGLALETLPPGIDAVVLVEATPDTVVLSLDGVQRRFAVTTIASSDGVETMAIDSSLGSASLQTVPRFIDPAAQAPAGALIAPMPGSIVAVHVSIGDTVVAGQPLVLLEAMKMEHAVTAATAGTVTEVSVSVGQQVEQGASLAVVEDATVGDDTTVEGSAG